MSDGASSSHEDLQDSEFVVFRCKECGKTSVSLGWLHAHAEKHRGFFGFQLPWKYGDVYELMGLTDVVKVTECETVELSEDEIDEAMNEAPSGRYSVIERVIDRDD